MLTGAQAFCGLRSCQLCQLCAETVLRSAVCLFCGLFCGLFLFLLYSAAYSFAYRTVFFRYIIQRLSAVCAVPGCARLCGRRRKGLTRTSTSTIVSLYVSDFPNVLRARYVHDMLSFE